MPKLPPRRDDAPTPLAALTAPTSGDVEKSSNPQVDWPTFSVSRLDPDLALRLRLEAVAQGLPMRDLIARMWAAYQQGKK